MSTRHLWVAAVIVATVAIGGSVVAQRATAEQFEVATIKSVDTSKPYLSDTRVYPGGRVAITARTLKAIVGIAFRYNPRQVQVPADEWIEKTVYRIEAKPPDGSSIKNLNFSSTEIEDERLRGMLQALLIERFQLKLHRETHTGDVYQLVRTGKTFGMRPSVIPKEREGTPLRSDIGWAGRWVIQFTSMQRFAQHAGLVMRAPVVDATGLSGLYDYRETGSSDDPDDVDPMSNFVRLLDRVGLALKRGTGPVETLVIDSAVKPSVD